MWAVYIAAMATLIMATPLVHWRRNKLRWDRHPGGSSGVLRDQVVSYAPTAAAVLVIVIAVAAVELGVISVRPGGLATLGVAAIVLALGAGAGFLPPIVAARRRLLEVRSPLRPRSLSSGRPAAGPRGGHLPRGGRMNLRHAPLLGELPAQPGEGA